jgi:hypothetical protein
MSLLEELIGQPLDQIPDDELDEIIMTGRIAREATEAPKKARKTSAQKVSETLFDADDFE